MEIERLNLDRIYLLGIGGAGQNALADILVDLGYRVSGSDLKLSATTDALARRGIPVFEGHRAENLNNSTLVVTTAAASPDHPELAEARRRGIPVLQNAELVGYLLNQKRLLAVAGTHGKTTTTGLVAYLLSKADLDPTFYIGGVSRDLGVAGRAGKGQFAVVEADEYARRFLNYRPQAAVITNLEADHLDYYGSFEALREAYVAFAGRVEQQLYLCADEPELLQLRAARPWTAAVSSYGLGVAANWRATDLAVNERGGYSFRLKRDGQPVGAVSLSLAGVHNVRNATGALAMVINAAPEVDPQRFCELAEAYRGAARRFEVKGETSVGVTVVDDYAHHPTEIRATLAAAKARYAGRRLVALFQPHTYSRTKALLDEFANAFGEADRVALLEIFPARETDTLGVSSQDILDRMAHPGKLSRPFSLDQAATALGEVLQKGDVLLTLGAGDVWKVGEQLLVQTN